MIKVEMENGKMVLVIYIQERRKERELRQDTGEIPGSNRAVGEDLGIEDNSIRVLEALTPMLEEWLQQIPQTSDIFL